MFLTGILSNMTTGVSGAAAEMATKGRSAYGQAAAENKWIQMIAGRPEHNAAIDDHYEKLRQQGARATGIRSMIRKGWDNQVAADYKDEGFKKRAGVIGLRQATGLAASVPVEAGIRYATGTGTFTRNENGERDIAGIPFV